ncbi:g6335 [Coccomyxa viridis]|uniref:G6335 protein n=1 Tax=Coccomyxa viridis TaxID=1274662 RepID=A0ABP1FZ36_9CHLO
MFFICDVEDKIRVDPGDLGRPLLDAVTSVIEQLYIDKVLHDLGLVITIYDILSIEGGFIYPSDGAAHYTVKFRLVVFRPFINEVLTGRLTRCDKEGLHVSLDFFDDIFIPEHALKDPQHFDEEEGLWYWDFEGNKMFYDVEEQVRFRVKNVKFQKPPSVQELRSKGGEDDLSGTAAKPIAIMQIIGSADQDGCGMVAWWEQQEEANGGAAMEGQS